MASNPKTFKLSEIASEGGASGSSGRFLSYSVASMKKEVWLYASTAEKLNRK